MTNEEEQKKVATGVTDGSLWRKRQEPEQEQAIIGTYLEKDKEQGNPVAWLLTDKNINSIQVDSIQRLIDRLKHAHHTDLCVRINGQDEWFEADWLKHMVRVTPPQRTWVELTEQERNDMEDFCEMIIGKVAFDAIEAKLKEKNNIT